MISPFKKNGEVDYNKAAKIAIRLVQNGCDSLIVSGTTGESSTLSDEEKEKLLQVIIGSISNKAKVIAGSGTNNTEHSIFLSKKAQKAGADGLLLVTPYYIKPTQDGLVKHFQSIASSTDLPIMLYDIPKRSSINLSLKTIIKLDKHPNIVAIKESSGNFSQATRAMSNTDLSFYSGDDSLIIPWIALGASGIVGVTSHLNTQLFRKLVNYMLESNLQKARLLNKRLDPIIRAIMTRVPGTVAIKYVFRRIGLMDNSYVRLPLSQPTSSEKIKIKQDLMESEWNFS